MRLSTRALGPGRPRDARLDGRLIEAATKVFLERGYQHASLSEVARRAGVGTPAIYRRWPTKASLAMDLLSGEAMPVPIPDSGSIRNDLTEFFKSRLQLWSTPLFHQVLLPLALEASADPSVAERFRKRFAEYQEPGVLDRVRKAIADGELRSDTDPGRLLEQLQGSIAIPLLFSQDLPDESQAAVIVDYVLDGFGGKGKP